ncbi:ABC transporter permease subunit [Mesorhizobium sp. M1C.F.Ca.ET.193.01.1.1]|uniref:ABC transporter permease subunit n=1 Tax=unclassified Mesorhizobium TaxID=325217 RepID=UPI000FD2D5DA|nr:MULTISPECIES: ABC transporter permease subunit [unclassified Mesorhizobium]TGT00060.1 ABC transporter permease subunit [bacterium M00.F.Ca.ET.177.01.1.1]TGQ53456.1 ABC transporter permease subunit [Mesorhizobium sp. M1C.F.Ca.ET.210.01.1.1]TGQ70723.1 ABC transporter permease subunit [Mesorhizobium sp. M1C.F.Ca.ET.212.01.1.1]TGR07296.1 ABC transporter permease subunit [Mesorhizobium sp. M1C.F.Ca.ET.204.01.1.1]TGR28170.1 ABC transporter permease subunit [Mesorhizobium sp. M1C.F.Ca.ET.196.01.1.
MISLLRNQKVRNALLQVFYVGSLAALVLAGVVIARRNLAEQGITSGFDFLYKSTGWDVSFSLLPVTANDPYWWFFLIGIINTLFLGSIGLLLATVVGTVVGLARTSSNELARLLGRTYVDIFRNIPLILQAFFWYAIITHLPTPRAAHEAWGMLLTSRGLYLPAPNVGGVAMALAILPLFAAVALPVWLGRTSRLSRPVGERLVIQLAGIAAALACAVLILIVGRLPDAPLLDFPALQGLNLKGGLRIPPEFSALAVAIAIYGGSYIAEIVRGGFKAVGKGQVEAALSLGLSPWRVFTLVKLPLALRAMLPILANQYVWLIKATTMGIAVGFTDFFMIVALTINHSGQTLEAIGILMAGFLTINLSLAAVFNRINKAIALKGNQLRG